MLRDSAPADDAALVELLNSAYRGTIDFDPDADHAEEIRTWRTQDGADDQASSVAVVDGRIVGACLVARDLGTAFLYEIAVEEGFRRQKIAQALLRRSIGVLADRGEDSLAGWVTDGNVASERLLTGEGFVPVTPAIGEDLGLGYYRAARVLAALGTPADVPAAATSDTDGVRLWVMDSSDREETSVSVRGVAVRVTYLPPDDSLVSKLAASALPLTRVSWFLEQR